MLLTEEQKKAWGAVQEAEIPSSLAMSKTDVVSVMLENQAKWLKDNLDAKIEISEAADPSNTAVGVTGGNSPLATWSPILMNMARRAAPNLLAFDIFGVQPMRAPDQQMFALRSRYNAQGGDEALVEEPNSAHAMTGTQGGDTSGFAANALGAGVPAVGTSVGTMYTTAELELLGTATAGIAAWKEMSFSIEKQTVSAEGMGLRSSWTREIEQDLRAVHGLDAEKILGDIMAQEMIAELNQYHMRKMAISAKIEDQGVTTAGIIDMAIDTDGRWMAERHRTLFWFMELAATKIARETRRGKGNFVVTSANIASAMAMAGILSDQGFMTSAGITGKTVDETGALFVGTTPTGLKVYVDPFASTDYWVVGYKGASAMDAGAFYCPYVALEIYDGVDSNSYQPSKGMKHRSGLVANPYVSHDLVAGAQTPKAGLGFGQSENSYFRKAVIRNLA